MRFGAQGDKQSRASKVSWLMSRISRKAKSNVAGQGQPKHLTVQWSVQCFKNIAYRIWIERPTFRRHKNKKPELQGTAYDPIIENNRVQFWYSRERRSEAQPTWRKSIKQISTLQSIICLNRHISWLIRSLVDPTLASVYRFIVYQFLVSHSLKVVSQFFYSVEIVLLMPDN